MGTFKTDEIDQILNAVIDTAIDSIVTISSSGIILTLNMATCALFGYSRNELIGENVKILMPHHHRQKHDAYINNYLSSKKPKIIGIGREVEGKRKDGNLFPLRLAVSEIILKDRIIFAGIMHDLTDLKAAQDKIISLNEELEEKVFDRTNQLEEAINRLLKSNELLVAKEQKLSEALSKEIELNALKTRFLQIASHEFKTPLSTVLSSASLISKYPRENQQDQRTKHIERIKKAVQHLTSILDDFLSLSRLEEGKTIINTEIVDINILINNIFSELSVIVKPSQQLIQNHSGKNTLLSDSKLIRSILFNLLSNSIKYAEKGMIVCESHISNNLLTLTIRDEGLGIPDEDQAHLFTRFYRAKNVENIQGTGLGLHIVKTNVELLKGKIEFVSQLGNGSTFVVTIPDMAG